MARVKWAGVMALLLATASPLHAQASDGWVDPFPKAEAPGAASDTPQETANKRIVLEFYDKAINAKDFEAASRFLGDRYIQHNPIAKDGPEGLKAFIEFLKGKFPKQHNDVKRVLTSGDYVILHVHSVQEPGTLGRVIGEIFRLENGKVVEHWDVIHPITGSPDPNNPNWVF